MSGPRKTVPTQSVTLTARDLTALVAPVLPFTEKDGTLPVLGAVKIEARGKWLVATATDRYRIAMQRIALEPPPDKGFAALIPVAVLARIRSTFKHTRRSNPALRLSLKGDELRVSAAEEFEGLFDASFGFRLINPVSDFPDLTPLIVKALKAEPAPSTEVALNAHFTADFATAATTAQPMKLSPTGNGKKDPWMVRIGEDFLGLIVPIRFAADAPHDERAEWLSLIQPAAPAKGKAA